MEALVPLMENASTLDWLTVGGLAWLIYRIRKVETDLAKHEDLCVNFRKGFYERIGRVESELAVVKDRSDKEKQP